MEYISSDTNVWVDFATIDRLEYPFRLPYTYLMNEDAVRDELLSPPGLGDKLLTLELQEVELTTEEFYLADEYASKYAKPSLHDCIALAIAKTRGIILLTGDGPLRKAAMAEGVQVMGTIGVLDRLVEKELHVFPASRRRISAVSRAFFTSPPTAQIARSDPSRRSSDRPVSSGAHGK